MFDLLRKYGQWNRKFGVALRLLVVLGILASLPLAFVRHQAEQSSKTVSIVFDYRRLLEVAAYRPNRAEFVAEHLKKLKEAGVNGMSLYEATLVELDLSRRIKVFSANDAAVLTGMAVNPAENATYVLLSDNPGGSEQELFRFIEKGFEGLNVKIEPWSFKGTRGLKIGMAREEANSVLLTPDPFTMRELRNQGFHIVARLSDMRQPFDPARMEAMLKTLKENGVNRIIFDGRNVTGTADQEELKSLNTMAELMNKYGMGLVAIEQVPQKGLNTLAYLTKYNVVRLHSLPDRESNIAPEVMASRFELAVTDRNIRMIYVNTRIAREPDKAGMIDTLDNIYKGLGGPDGAVAKIKGEGFTIGVPEPFRITHAGWMTALKAVVVAGAAALIAMLVGAFAPPLTLAAFGLLAAGSAGLLVLSESMATQGLALGASIAAPTLAMIWAFQRVEKSHGKLAGFTSRFGFSLRVFGVTLAISAAGIFYIVGLLTHPKYYYVLDQFRGVTVLHLVPIVLAGLYVLLYTNVVGLRGAAGFKQLLQTKVTVLWVIAAAVIGAVVVYYLTRTGNSATVSPYERMFRLLLEDTFGVRPRTKEFLLSHPLFLLGIYVALKYRAALFVMLVGVIGQLSIVDTFAHLHTPLWISAVRDVLGAGLGILFGLLLIGVWEAGTRLATKGWKLWQALAKES